jgi:hypothetical protein
LSFLEVILGDEPVLRPQQLLYQRLLAMDQEEARNIVEAELREKSLEDLYETVLIPALRLAEEDRHTDAFGEQISEFIYQSLRELIEELGDRMITQGTVDEALKNSVASDNRLGEMQVVCIPARDDADELVGMMFAQILQQAGGRATYLPIGTVNDMLEQVERGGFQIACLSALPPFAVGQARSLCKRLRARFPQLVIIVGLWEFAGGVLKAQERVAATCANAVATTLAEGLLQVRRLSSLDLAEASSLKIVGENDPGVQTESLQRGAGYR